MKKTTARSELEKKAAEREKNQYVLRLYITGATPRSATAIRNIQKICSEHLAGRYRLEVIDIYQQPQLARGQQIFATPTLVKYLPSPLKRVIGDLADTEKVLMGLDLRPKPFESH